jgi:hypothetical protein
MTNLCRATKTLLATAVMSALLLSPRSSVRAQCDGCPGDLDGSGQVTIDEIIAVVNAALSPCDGRVLFSDEFLGRLLNVRRWAAASNGYAPNAIVVGGGTVRIGAPDTVSLDFPYVASGPLPVPADGRVEIEVVMRYTGVGANGSILAVLGANGRSLVRIRDNDALGLTLAVGGARQSLDQLDAGVFHTYTLTFRGGQLDVAVDGVRTLGSFPVDSPPQRIWIGHPTIGQTFGIDETDERPPGIDDSGEVVSRSWSRAEWSTIEVDAVRLRRLPDAAN